MLIKRIERDKLNWCGAPEPTFSHCHCFYRSLFFLFYNSQHNELLELISLQSRTKRTLNSFCQFSTL